MQPAAVYSGSARVRQRVAGAHDADEAVPHQRLRPHLRAHGAAHHTGFQVHRAVAQQPLALGLAWRYLPRDRRTADTSRARFDGAGTVLLALTLAAYPLAMTTGRGAFGALNLALLLGALAGLALFLRVQAQAESPLIRLARLRAPVLGAGCAMSVLVSTVKMATLVVGPFHLGRALGLHSLHVGLWPYRSVRWWRRSPACRPGAWWTATARSA
jgi:hypothetical protein